MSRQLKIRPGPPVLAALRATGGDEFPTGRINSIAERYLVMIEAARPGLSRDEWLSLFDALGDGVGLLEEFDLDQAGSGAWDGIVAAIADAPRRTGRNGVDLAQLAAKIGALPEMARIAIVETAQRFWALSDLPDDEALDLAASHPATWPAN